MLVVALCLFATFMRGNCLAIPFSCFGLLDTSLQLVSFQQLGRTLEGCLYSVLKAVRGVRACVLVRFRETHYSGQEKEGEKKNKTRKTQTQTHRHTHTHTQQCHRIQLTAKLHEDSSLVHKQEWRYAEGCKAGLACVG